MTTARNVVEALVFACSQDPAVLKEGENYLKQCELQAGFYTVLAVSCSMQHRVRVRTCLVGSQKVWADRQVDVPVRWMAITYIKNGVDRYWRPGAPKYVQNSYDVRVLGQRQR